MFVLLATLMTKRGNRKSIVGAFNSIDEAESAQVREVVTWGGKGNIRYNVLFINEDKNVTLETHMPYEDLIKAAGDPNV